jgi:hypothetical protein
MRNKYVAHHQRAQVFSRSRTLLKPASAGISKLLCLSERTVEDNRLNIRRKPGLSRGDDVHEVPSALQLLLPV